MICEMITKFAIRVSDFRVVRSLAVITRSFSRHAAAAAAAAAADR